jgi:hypothetical protein
MNKTIKILLIWFILLPLFIFSFNVFKYELRFSHQTLLVYNPPFPWSRYLIITPIKKLYIKLFNNGKTGLPTVKLVTDKDVKKILLQSTPNSTKEWKNASLEISEGKTKKVKIRYRGDNPRNWLLEKRKIGIRTEENNLINGQRYFDFWPIEISKLIPTRIAHNMNILTSNPKIVELYINGQSNGAYMKFERINKYFLKKNNLENSNLYKGENKSLEYYIGINDNLFNNPSLWKKESSNKSSFLANKNDLINFLTVLQSAETRKKDFEKLKTYLDLETWSKYLAFITITTNYQHIYNKNTRLIINPNTGVTAPIITDPGINMRKKSRKDKLVILDFTTNDLVSLLTRSSVYIDRKYHIINDYIKNKKVFDNEISFLNNDLKKLNITLSRDFEINKSNFTKEVNFYKDYLERVKIYIVELLNAKPESSWFINKNGFSINIDKHIPISEISVKFKTSNTLKWVVVDENYNNKVDENEKKFLINSNGEINLPITLYANRLKLTNKKYLMHNQDNIEVVNTRFNFIGNEKAIPLNISAKNPFSKKNYQIKNKKTNSVQKSKFNEIIFN